MLKRISVASANDACVAMDEYICGNEEEFVNRMNQRAAENSKDRFRDAVTLKKYSIMERRYGKEKNLLVPGIQDAL